MKTLLTFLLLTSLVNKGTAPKVKLPSVPGGPCCLCECGSVDQNHCSRMCVRLQHSHRVVEEPEMRICTKTCEEAGVERTHPAPDMR